MERIISQAAVEMSVFDRLSSADVETPALVFDLNRIAHDARIVQAACRRADCTLFYSLKPCTLLPVLNAVAPFVDGFSCSSPFEARLARTVTDASQSVHCFGVGFNNHELRCLSGLCDAITLNSIGQWQRLWALGMSGQDCGIRVNPCISLVDDERYDPCRDDSKLGVTSEQLTNAAAAEPALFANVSGLHIHNNCDASDFNGLLQTVSHICDSLPDLLRRIKWFNLGGGYILDETTELEPFQQAVAMLRNAGVPTVIFEPGATFVNRAGSIVARVIDLIDGGRHPVAILDTSVNHMPEVFEYQYEPDVLEAHEEGDYTYILAGRTCLAGDLFGEYNFREPLRVDDPVVFINVGAYTTVKWHTFNGINLPEIHVLNRAGQLEAVKQFTYTEFASKNGVPRDDDL